MNYEILKKIPISGEYDEIHFGKNDVHSLWIKFYPVDSDCWFGSFASGSVGVSNVKIIEHANSSQVSILAYGAYYIVDIKSKTLIFHPTDDYFNDFKIIPDENLIFLASYYNICIFKEYKIIKKIKPDFIDGIRFKEIQNDVLLGEIYNPGIDWSDFELNIKTLRMKWDKSEY